MKVLDSLFIDLPPAIYITLFFVAGACIGTILTRWIVVLTQEEHELSKPNVIPADEKRRWSHHIPVLGFFLSRGERIYRGESIATWGLLVEIGTGLLFAGFVAAYVNGTCQNISEVQPDPIWWYARILYHLLLIGLLVAATGTDFRNYTIPDQITVTGIGLGIAGAFLSGDLQMIHLWVDWNDEILGLRGPYIPEWLKAHRHWHGLAWSVTGMAAGAAITWIVRAASKLVLGREALGFGDVTLMAMIGSFVGWQPIIVIFALAPVCGLSVALGIRVLFGHKFVPYGPFLCSSTLAVLFTWRSIWTFRFHWSDRDAFSISKIFSDALGLAILLGIAFSALVLLLGIIRLYRNIPVKPRAGEKIEDTADE
jgi:leader peptidase (prepilin peptidase)/N-methyltransferase